MAPPPPAPIPTAPSPSPRDPSPTPSPPDPAGPTEAVRPAEPASSAPAPLEDFGAVRGTPWSGRFATADNDRDGRPDQVWFFARLVDGGDCPPGDACPAGRAWIRSEAPGASYRAFGLVGRRDELGTWRLDSADGALTFELTPVQGRDDWLRVSYQRQDGRGIAVRGVIRPVH